MPQKKNPDLLELVRGKSGRVVGNATALMIDGEGIAAGIQQRFAGIAGAAFRCCRYAAADAAAGDRMDEGGGIPSRKMQEAAASGFMNAWAAATYLVKRGVPSRLAHERIGKAVQICIERGCELHGISAHDLQALSPAFGADFYESLTLSSVLTVHDVPGGTAPARVRQAIGIARKRIEALREEVHAHA